MTTLNHSLFSLILMVLMALAYGRQRRGLPVPIRWHRYVAMGFAGAGVVWALVLLYTVVVVESKHWDWLPVYGDSNVCWISFICAYSAVVSFLLRRWRRGWTPPADGREPERRLAGAQLLLGLAVLLVIPWFQFHDLAPYLLDCMWLRHYIGYTGLTCMGRDGNEVMLDALNGTAALTLLLWLFQHGWGRAMREREKYDASFPTA